MSPRAPASRAVRVVTYPGVQSLDVTGPIEVLSLANRFCVDPPEGSGLVAQPAGSPPPYDVEVVAHQLDGPAERLVVRTTSGLLLGVDRRITSARPARRDRGIDTVLVVGGEGTPDAATDPVLLAWLRAVSAEARRTASVCSGAFILAAAGLLDGRRATTHWSECETLRRLFPKVAVEDDPIFVRDGNVVTSAGITAGIDLTLALVEEDLGRDLALAVSRWLVVFAQRPGGQSQFSSQLAGQLAERRPIRELQAWVADHPADDCSVAALAARSAMSPRNFARVFAAEAGMPPAAWVEQVRVESARRLLETTELAIAEVATAAGFGTVETLERAFRRRVNTSPRGYRARFTFATTSS